MVRSYLRHEPTQAFGLIASPQGNSLFDGKLAYVPALEDILVWHVKTAKLVSMWHSPSHTSPVTRIASSNSTVSSSSSSSSPLYAVGYQDGSVRLWSFPPSTSSQEREATEIVCFNGHKKSVTAMSWDHRGGRLASGGTEGEIVIWDVEDERGIVRLHSHRSPISSLTFLPHPTVSNHPGYLISTSLDTLLKLWDLQTSHCIQTVVAHRAGVSAASVRFIPPGEDAVIGEDGEEEGKLFGQWEVATGSQEGEVKGWVINEQSLVHGIKEADDGELPVLIHPLSSVPLPTSSSPITNLAYHPTSPLLFVLTSDKTVSALRIRTDAEVDKKKARRKKREREKKKDGAAAAADDEDKGEEKVTTWGDKFVLWCQIHSSSKIKSFSFSPDTEETAAASSSSVKPQLTVLIHNASNAVSTHSVPLPPSTGKPSKDVTPESNLIAGIDLPGHRADIRCLDISGGDDLVASGSNGQVKIWNLKTLACVRTMETGYAICLTWLPGDRHIIVGTKAGTLLLYDVSSSTLISETQAHTAAIWSIQVRPDGKGLVSGSADKDVKFWDFELVEMEDVSQTVVDRMGNERKFKNKVLTIVHTRTLKMTDDVLSVRYTPDGKFLAIALLDATVKVFYQDTLKFFLSLYGHKLPVLSMDVSADSKLLITSSADKNIKIWGLDFGDCHKSIYAHEESVMAVQFENEGHYFWSVGKDRAVKYWDGDKFEMIQKLEGHHGEVWALATSKQGKFVVTGSHDRSIRVWEKTDEPLFLDEEREKETDRLFDANLAESLNRTADHEAQGAETAEATEVTKQTSDTLMAGEKIMEALDLADEERLTYQDYLDAKKTLAGSAAGDQLQPPEKNPLLKAMGDIDPEENVLKVVEKIPNASLTDALVVLPFRYVTSMLQCLSYWAQKEWNTSLLSRILLFLLRTHHAQIVSNNVMRPTIISLRTYLRSALRRQKETVGYNLAALKFLQRQVESDKTASFWETEGMDEEKVRAKIEEGQKKRKRVII
ncbi:WD40-repeat-containing subunit of the 18S rRNA processing complex [Phaffia rhodozyma]|uniref:WD40-repeat-containing subunit of the 18S rRNA processing complex n=1 Tax=Phaffia rhodozyma TaxID=264483 RepID=A0A0F7SQI5_PHARH|nr:WD40-repeat-containing subunit of the 18S rRNA processing complex [Phaffia rhodozyma]